MKKYLEEKNTRPFSMFLGLRQPAVTAHSRLEGDGVVVPMAPFYFIFYLTTATITACVCSPATYCP